MAEQSELQNLDNYPEYPFNTIILFSCGDDGYVKEHIAEIPILSESNESIENIEIDENKKKLLQKTINVQALQRRSLWGLIFIAEQGIIFTANNNKDITQFQFDLANHQLFQTRILKGHTDFLNCISLSNSKMYLCSCGDDEKVRVWDVANGKERFCLNTDFSSHQNDIFSCCWNQDDSLIATGDREGKIVVWAIPKANTQILPLPYCILQAQEDNSVIRCLKFSPVNSLSLFAIYNDSSVIRSWDIPQQKTDLNQLNNFNQQTESPFQLNICQRKSTNLHSYLYSFDIDARGEQLVCGAQHLLIIFNAITLEIIKSIDNGYSEFEWICSVIWSRDEKYIIVGTLHGKIEVFDTKKEKWVLKIDKAHSGFIKTVVINESTNEYVNFLS